ncbi:hypothetical protein CFC21_054445 [Triticum aestivum]|uniref:High-affinity nitrate transporter n=4 Tax=Triticum TaxID=4564 RepID=A0A9R0W545_TRITD|nr:hypothetical protein CFC21_054445 [Triticum aestivum]VAH97710.1 unnamed protein product [Triticum turgidum subsp. durum]
MAAPAHGQRSPSAYIYTLNPSVLLHLSQPRPSNRRNLLRPSSSCECEFEPKFDGRSMARSELVMALLVAVLAAGCCASAGAVAYLSKLPVTLDVTASPSPGQVLHAGEDVITVTWALNATGPAGDAAAYKSVKVSLCYAPASQKEREWRKTHDDLKKDKTCQFKVAQQPYAGAGGSVEYRVALDIPTAAYYVRAYALDASGTQVAYGQTAPAAAFNVVSITGVTTSIKVAAGVFSTFSVVSLAFFFFIEKRKKNN